MAAGISPLDRAERLQNLYIRLLFCEPIVVEWRRDADAVLAEFGLEPADRALLPDCDSENFISEARGRRQAVRREMGRWFGRTAGVLEQRESNPATPLPGIDDFLGSDHFHDPMKALPHPYGVGPGYESISKYFFWLREVHRLVEPGADIELRTAVYSDFAQYLMDQISRPCHEFYKRFTGGVYWPQIPGQAAPVHLVSDQMYFFTIQDPAKISQLSQIGLQNLDAVAPVAWELEPNIC